MKASYFQQALRNVHFTAEHGLGEVNGQEELFTPEEEAMEV